MKTETLQALLMLTLITAADAQAAIFFTKPIVPPTPANTIFAFDLHKVIAHSVGFHERWQILWHSKARMIILKYFPILSYVLYQNRGTLHVAEKAFKDLIMLYPELAQCTETFLAIVNAQKPIVGTHQIMKQLHMQGFKLYLFSNIGEETFDDLRQRHPELLQYIDDFCVVTAAHNWAHKPHAYMYQHFINKFDPERTKQIIFIDDLIANVQAGANAGMISILFTDPIQLHADLQTLGVRL